MQAIVRSLAPDGRVVLVEYRGEQRGTGVLPLHQMTEAQVRKEMAAVGLELEVNHDPLPIQYIPLFVAGVVGVVLGEAWGYVLFGASGTIALYINIILWFMEKEYVYPSLGPLRYFTYFWGFFVYWGGLAVVYSIFRVANL